MPADRADAGSQSRESTAVELMVGPRVRNLEGFQVNRVWPTARRRLIGPFVFFDHLLPVELAAGRGFDVPPHPHIGLATVTYLFEGELVHRDSLGSERTIFPGELNWMTAGRGITHSERSSELMRATLSRLHGIQIWVAVPSEHESDAPGFVHYAADRLPAFEGPGARFRVIAGTAFGHESPVATLSRLFYVEVDLMAGARVSLESGLGERAAYIVSGSIRIEGDAYDSGRLLVLANGLDASIEALHETKLMLLGGARLEGPRYIGWNFVSSSPEKIDEAVRDWDSGRFPKVPGDDGYMPLPGRVLY